MSRGTRPTISGSTRVAAVIGDPVSHSFSPAMHNAAFQALGLDAVYVALHVLPKDLGRAVAGFRAANLIGFNVTVPHKETIIRYLDSVSPAARQTGAVNTVVNRKGKLHGENTDVIGFRRALEENGYTLRGKHILMIGAGGAARAVLSACRQSKAKSVTIANRTKRRATTLAKAFASANMAIHVCRLDDVADPARLSQPNIVVNSSSLGLSGEPFVTLATEASDKDCLYFDLIPKAQTPFLGAAKACKRPRLDGRDMLLYQGAAAFELWNGVQAPIEVMRRALRRQLD